MASLASGLCFAFILSCHTCCKDYDEIPPSSMSCRWLPFSTMPSSVSTRIRSALRMVVSRWAMVRWYDPWQAPLKNAAPAFRFRCPGRRWLRPGLKIGGFFRNTGRCSPAAFCPPEALRPLAHIGIVAVGQVHDELMGAGHGGADDFFLSCAGLSVADVFHKWTRRMGIPPAERCRSGSAGTEGDILDILAVDENPAGGDPRKTWESNCTGWFFRRRRGPPGRCFVPGPRED